MNNRKDWIIILHGIACLAFGTVIALTLMHGCAAEYNIIDFSPVMEVKR